MLFRSDPDGRDGLGAGPGPGGRRSPRAEAPTRLPTHQPSAPGRGVAKNTVPGSAADPLTRRPARPAWTGSPERLPSSVPPVDIPQEIRDRALAGSAPEEEGAGAVLTPPGAGGDVHGSPEVGPQTPTPPHPEA